MGILAYNILYMLRNLAGEQVKGSMELLIKRLIKIGVKVAYRGREVACPCGVGLSFGPVPPSYVWVSSAEEEMVDGATQGEVRSETG